MSLKYYVKILLNAMKN